jgi:hypothetical protein
MDINLMLTMLSSRLNMPPMSLDTNGRLHHQLNNNTQLDLCVDHDTQFFYLVVLLGTPRQEDCAELLYELLQMNAVVSGTYSPYFAYNSEKCAILLCVAIPLSEVTVDVVEFELRKVIELAHNERVRLNEMVRLEQ